MYGPSYAVAWLRTFEGISLPGRHPVPLSSGCRTASGRHRAVRPGGPLHTDDCADRAYDAEGRRSARSVEPEPGPFPVYGGGTPPPPRPPPPPPPPGGRPPPGA